MKNSRIKVLILFLSVAFACCDKKEPAPTKADFKYDYFPLKIGSWIMYDVDSANYSTSAGVIKSSYQLLDTITSTFYDNQGRISHRIERYRRNFDSLQWDVEGVYFATRTANAAESIEDLRFIKITFPPSLKRKWKGNVYIDVNTQGLEWYADWDYEITGLDENIMGFDSVLTVTEINDTSENLIEARFSLAQYAKNIGMVYKKTFHLEYRTSNIDSINFPWEIKANYGFIIEMKINSYGGF